MLLYGLLSCLPIIFLSITQKANKQDYWIGTCSNNSPCICLIKPDWQAFVVNPAPRVEVFISLHSRLQARVHTPTLVMHESPSVLWAREGAIGSANIGFDLCIAKDVISWLRFSDCRAKLCVPALHFLLSCFGIFFLVIRAVKQTKFRLIYCLEWTFSPFPIMKGGIW